VTDWDSDDWPLIDWLEDMAAPISTTIISAQGSFSRGKGLNMAAEAAKGDKLFFLDADALLCAALIEASVRYAADNKAYFPILYSFDDAEHRTGQWIDAGYGHCAVKRSIFEQIGRWPEYNKWGGEDDKFFAAMSAAVPIIRERVNGFFHQWHPNDLTWKSRYYETYPDLLDELRGADAVRGLLREWIPTGSTFILVDETRLGDEAIAGSRALPFLESRGEYAGPPADDETAIRELERMRSGGATFVAFAWLAYWWLEHYSEFHQYLRSHYRRVLANERLVLFDLRTLER